jgi:hypothetical protein
MPSDSLEALVMKRVFWAFFSLGALLVGVGKVDADFVAPVPTFTFINGANGSGVDEYGVGYGNLSEPRINFTNVGTLGVGAVDIHYTVNSKETYDISEAPGYGFLENSSGVHWDTVTWQILSGTSGAQVQSATSYSNTQFPNVTTTATTVVFSGPAGQNSGVSTDLDVMITTTGAGTFDIIETPGHFASVPEPPSLVLCGIGTLAMLAFTWRRGKPLTANSNGLTRLLMKA